MNDSKKELEEKGYMQGKYVIGADHAHKCCDPHTEVFNCKMYGTFNVYLKHGRIDHFVPSIVTEKKSYWFVKITRTSECWYGWAIRDHKSKQKFKTLEILTKERLPQVLTKGNFAVNIYEPWNREEIRIWAKDKYWFQSFPFSPKKRADSSFIWDTINVIDWSGLSVLDIGCHYGYHSFKAAGEGAKVIGFEPNRKCLEMARTIQKHIWQEDVSFVQTMPLVPENFDVILYLSVHHQPDPEYAGLRKKINELKKMTIKHLFVELIMPPMFPSGRTLSEDEIDKIVGGKILARYKHNVRGYRKIYWLEKENG